MLDAKDMVWMQHGVDANDMQHTHANTCSTHTHTSCAPERSIGVKEYWAPLGVATAVFCVLSIVLLFVPVLKRGGKERGGHVWSAQHTDQCRGGGLHVG